MQENPVPVPTATETMPPALQSPATHHKHLKLARKARRHVQIELVLGLFGFYGVGYLLSRKFGPAFGNLLFSAAWLVIRFGLLAVTGGFALIVLLPLTFFFAISHSITLRHMLRTDLIAHEAEAQ